ncbi:MAG: cytochrome c family protein [Rhodospirillaceae bacterium]|nr:cytochrome c family protein [Rhodospirillaceae bacterium]|tara:strand:+ start:2795 stop:3376 length:582 start_codon:yes stop_codon:yes gene_type:complete
MASLEMNKIAAGVLCAGLIAMAAGKVADILVDPEELEKNAYIVDTGKVSSATASAAPVGPTLEPVLGLLDSADSVAGQKVFKKCAACHSVTNGGKHKLGPNLYEVVNSKIGSKAGFGYSKAMRDFTNADNWNYAALNGFLKKPKEYMPGTKMGFAGIKKVSDRASVIAYLRSLAETPVPLPTPEEIAKEASGN